MARLNLFYGNNSQASLKAFQRWRQLFEQKHGEANRYLIEADELTVAQIQEKIAQILQMDSLFAGHRLLLIKRLTSHDRNRSAPAAQAVLTLLRDSRVWQDALFTLAIWEERGLAPEHLLYTQFQLWQREGEAKLHLFTTPAVNQVGRIARQTLQEMGFTLSDAGVSWLQQQYTQLGALARLQGRLRRQDELAQDERSWWLVQILEGAALRASNNLIGPETLAAGQALTQIPTSVFSVGESLLSGHYQKASEQIREWQDDSSFYAFLAAFRWQVKRARVGAERRQQLLGLLLDVELIAKNFTLPLAWLVDMAILRLDQAGPEGRIGSILEHKKLWLAHLARS